MARIRKHPPGVDPRLLIKDAAKLMPDPTRRAFLRGGASLGALAFLTGCDIVDSLSAEKALTKVSYFNDRVQGWLFNPNKLAPTYPDSAVTRRAPTRLPAGIRIRATAARGATGTATSGRSICGRTVVAHGGDACRPESWGVTAGTRDGTTPRRTLHPARTGHGTRGATHRGCPALARTRTRTRGRALLT